MAETEERPYFEYSISQLEELFELVKSDSIPLKALDFELSFRTTNRAAKLRSRVAEALAAISIKRGRAAGADGDTSSAGHSTSAVAFPEDRGSRTNLTQKQSEALKNRSVPPPVDLGEFPSIPIPQNANEPVAILAAWTALEALSPQTIAALRISWPEIGAVSPVFRPLDPLGRSENVHGRNDSCTIK